ncbi:MAG TPA: hypothetical protein VJP80_02865 [Candidatus Saccharimonadales bacterium]|nr:hypothetical protein [Candidatus Saccharimonadales bacterium]
MGESPALRQLEATALIELINSEYVGGAATLETYFHHTEVEHERPYTRHYTMEGIVEAAREFDYWPRPEGAPPQQHLWVNDSTFREGDLQQHFGTHTWFLPDRGEVTLTDHPEGLVVVWQEMSPVNPDIVELSFELTLRHGVPAVSEVLPIAEL